MLDHGKPRTDDIATLLASRRSGYSLPAELYTSDAAWRADCATIFGRHWIAVGVTCELPEAGDVMAIDIGPASIVILRDDEDQLRAFHNVCFRNGRSEVNNLVSKQIHGLDLYRDVIVHA